MIANKLEVKRYNMTTDKYDHPVPYETEHGHWVKYSRYKALQAECEKLEKDAERYRWLRDGNDEEDSEAIHIAVHYYGDMWDEMIDIAMKEESK